MITILLIVSLIMIALILYKKTKKKFFKHIENKIAYNREVIKKYKDDLSKRKTEIQKRKRELKRSILKQKKDINKIQMNKKIQINKNLRNEDQRLRNEIAVLLKQHMIKKKKIINKIMNFRILEILEKITSTTQFSTKEYNLIAIKKTISSLKKTK